jgi:hypothetical protein
MATPPAAARDAARPYQRVASTYERLLMILASR